MGVLKRKAKKVEKVLKKYEDIGYDEVTEEVLCGGNRYVHEQREVTEDVRETVKIPIR